MWEAFIHSLKVNKLKRLDRKNAKLMRKRSKIKEKQLKLTKQYEELHLEIKKESSI
jgi:predicted nuclease with TOPRIM domain